MSPHKDWFIDLDETEFGIVMLGNNKACKINGISFVKIRMFDGCDRILRNVRYVPELRRNLVSLGVLDEIWCSIKIENGFMKIIKGAMTIMKGKLISGLYYLIGENVIGFVAVISENDKYKMSLWHKRLGHVSEQGLVVLFKEGLFGKDKMGGLDFCQFCAYG